MKYITIDKCQYFYRISKRALEHKTAVICIHGSGADSVVWSYQLSRLSRHFKVVVPDLPGHGRSEGSPFRTAEAYSHWLERFSESLSINSAYIVGHSFGGAIAQEYAHHYPDKTRGLVLAGTGVKFKFSKIYCDLYEHGLDLNQNKYPDEIPAAKNVSPDFINGFNALKEMSSNTLHDDLLAAGKFDSTAWISAINVPSLVIWGQKDTITPRELPQQLSDLLPNAGFKQVEKSGHVVMIDARDEFNAAVKEFIEVNE